MGWDGTERRRRKRYAVKNSTLRYRKGAGLFAFLMPPSPRYLVLNFSELGLHFITREEMRPGQGLRISMDAPGVRGTIGAPGRVVWCRKSEEINAFRVGCEFGAMGGGSKRVLKNLLDSAILENVEISTKIYLKEIERL